MKKYNLMTAKMDTICPTLNATECRYCYKLGHTAKFCPILEERKKNETSRVRENRNIAQVRPAEKVIESQKPTNVFAALYDSDEENESQADKLATETATNVDEFPALGKMGRLPSITEVRSYSCIAATPVDLTELARKRDERLKIEPKLVKWVDPYEESDEESEYQNDEPLPEITIPSELMSKYNVVDIWRYSDDDNDW